MRGLLSSPPFVWFICARMWGRGVLPAALPALFSATLSPALLVYLWENVGPQGLLVVRLPAPLVPHSARLGCHGHASPLRPGARLRPSYWSGCMFLFYLLGVGLPCHSTFCQFWLWEEAQCVYLRRHLGSQSWLFLICALTEDQTHNLGVLG